MATLLGRSPGSFFDEVVDSVLGKNKITIESADGGTPTRGESVSSALPADESE